MGDSGLAAGGRRHGRQFSQRRGLSAAARSEPDPSRLALPGVRRGDPFLRQRARAELAVAAGPLPHVRTGDQRPLSSGRDDNRRAVRSDGRCRRTLRRNRSGRSWDFRVFHIVRRASVGSVRLSLAARLHALVCDPDRVGRQSADGAAVRCAAGDRTAGRRLVAVAAAGGGKLDRGLGDRTATPPRCRRRSVWRDHGELVRIFRHARRAIGTQRSNTHCPRADRRLSRRAGRSSPTAHRSGAVQVADFGDRQFDTRRRILGLASLGRRGDGDIGRGVTSGAVRPSPGGVASLALECDSAAGLPGSDLGMAVRSTDISRSTAIFGHGGARAALATRGSWFNSHSTARPKP
jgi:hypothetical protein